MPTLTPVRPLAIGDQVKLKAEQESSYRPQSLLNYLADNGLTEANAVFTITAIFTDHQGTKVDFAELDTRGGYYLRRFELARVPAVPAQAVAGPDLTAYSQAAVDRLVSQARQDAVDEFVDKINVALLALLRD